jgi:hypothetical protein
MATKRKTTAATAPRVAKAGDKVQTESGADVNALRFNIPKGETREYVIVASKQLPTGSEWVIAAQVAEDDVDLDTCVVKGWRPVKGETGAFTHTLNGEMVCRKA